MTFVRFENGDIVRENDLKFTWAYPQPFIAPPVWLSLIGYIADEWHQFTTQINNRLQVIQWIRPNQSADIAEWMDQ
jgi:hypothetical protein